MTISRSEYESVTFYIVEESLGNLHTEKAEIQSHFLSKGARLCPPPPKEEGDEGEGGVRARFDVSQVNVVVSNTINFPEYESIERFNKGRTGEDRKWVVTPLWLLRMERCEKWQHPQYFSPDPKLYFSGVCICVSDEMSSGDRDSIHAAVAAFGGQTKIALTTEVSHLLCPTIKGAMYKVGIDHAGHGLQVVLPHWFDDCVKAGLKLPTAPYSWPDPPILKGDPTQFPSDIPLPQRELLRHDTYADETKPAPQVSAYDYNEILKGKKIVCSLTMEMERSRLEGIKAMIRRSGGEVLEGREEKTVLKCDILVTKHRAGPSYNAAVRGEKQIGTIAWLYHVCLKGEWTDPKAHLLHYPIPEGSIKAFENFIFTVTNYTGDSREYIKKIIDLMGGRFTADMGRKNTHVIAASNQGAKVVKARSWNLTLVNHHWLEACFIRWTVVDHSTNPLYTVDPHGLSAQPIIATKGFVNADLQPWTDAAYNEVLVEEEEDAMEVEDGLVPSGASGRDRGDVEMQLEDEDTDDELPEMADIGKKGKGKARIVEDVEMEGNEPPKKRKPTVAFLSKSTPDFANPSVLSLSVKPPIRRSTLNVFEEVGVSEIAAAKASTSTLKGQSSRTVASMKPSSSPRRANGTRQDSREPSSTPKPEGDDEGDSDERPARPKPASTNAHASTSKTITTTFNKPIPPSKKPISTTKGNAVASGSGPDAGTPRGAARGVSPSSVLPPRSRRKAADNAERLLHETIMPDLLSYEKAKRNGTLMKEPKRRTSGGDDSGDERARGGRSSSPGKKRKKAKEEEASSGDEEGDQQERSRSKGQGRAKTEETEDERSATTKKPKKPTVKVIARVVTTKVTLSDKQVAALATLGAKITSEVSDCTHLVTSEISRTEKFLAALAVVPAIVNEEWVADSIAAGRLLDPEPPYLLSDPANEKKLNMSLEKVLRRAASNKKKGGLLAGKTFWVTKNVETSFEVLKKLVESGGGELLKTNAKASVILENPDTKFFISCAKDKAIWKPLAEKGVTVYDRELVLTGLIQQQLEFERFAMT